MALDVAVSLTNIAQEDAWLVLQTTLGSYFILHPPTHFLLDLTDNILELKKTILDFRISFVYTLKGSHGQD